MTKPKRRAGRVTGREMMSRVYRLPCDMMDVLDTLAAAEKGD